MSIYKHLGRNYGFESTLESAVEVEEMANEIEDFEDFHEEMVRESALDMAKVQGGMYVTEQLIENALFTAEDHEVEALIESAIGDFFTKIKENLIKLWNKIKAWFKHVFEMVKRFFMSGKELVKKYKAQITSAAAKHSDVEIKSFKWAPKALSSKADAMLKDIENVAFKQAGSALVGAEDFDTTEAKKNILNSGVGGEKVNEISKTLKETARVGQKEKHTVGELGINTFIETVADASNMIKTIEKANKDIDKTMRAAIQDVDALTKEGVKEEKGNAENIALLKKQASNYSELVRYGATLRTTVVKVYTAEVKTMAAQMTSVLKALLNKAGYKDNVKAKEGAFADVYDLLGY